MKIPRTVKVLGIVSFFNDLASEMIYPIVPIFLTTVLKTSVPALGVIEGIAEATASLSKYWFGTFSDYLQNRKRFVVTGYSLAAISKVLIGVATIWPLVLFARFVDRIGKGVRTAARDSLLLEQATAQNRGLIFGFHRALDSLGAVGGPLLALLLLWLLHDNIRLTFFIAVIPATIAVILLVVFIKDHPVAPAQSRQRVKIRWHEIHPQLKVFLLVNFVFALGNSSDAFIILRGQNLGLSTTMIVLAYVLYNVVQATFATPAGHIADKIGARRVFMAGLCIFALVYAGFAFISDSSWLWVLLPVYGLYIAFTDGVGKAVIGEYIKPEESGTFYGLFYTIVAVGSLFASIAGGLLWDRVGPAAPFWLGSVMAIAALIISLYPVKKLQL